MPALLDFHTRLRRINGILKSYFESPEGLHMRLEQQLTERLNTLQPSHLEVSNESAGHGGYFPGKESHFKVVVVSEEFQGLRLAQRHQKIYAVAAELMSPGKIHALAIHAYIPSEWQGQAPASPECAHAPKN